MNIAPIALFSRVNAIVLLAGRRSREQVIRDILELAMGEGTIISNVMFKVGLTSNQANGYLQYLIQHGLIEEKHEENRGRKTFHTTPKGVHFISVAEVITELMKRNSLLRRS